MTRREKIIREVADNHWEYVVEIAILDLEKALAQQAEPGYFGLTKDHTWLSIDKAQYDKLKPRGRMACIVRSEK